MIVVDPGEMSWGAQYEEAQPIEVTIFTPSHHRISELLGPDGEPLEVAYERPALGFDLRPKSERGQ